MTTRLAARRFVSLAALVLATLAGCSPGVETGSYGRMRTRGINGTGALAALFREKGHEVRSAVRLTDELSEWADVIVRFSPHLGPPPLDEGNWYTTWLDEESSRRVVYVVNDYDAEPDYWTRALEQLPNNEPARTRERIDKALNESKGWAADRRPVHGETAPVADWFEVKAKANAPRAAHNPIACKVLGGPWAAGVNAGEAALVRDEALKQTEEVVLLSGDGETLAMSWSRPNDSRVLALASGTFLLNAAVTYPERRKLTAKVVDWAGFDGDEGEGEPGVGYAKRIAFVEGANVMTGPTGQRTPFQLLTIDPFGRVIVQFLALGLAAGLARAPRLGRAKADPPSDAERPVAHPEALGALLARAGQSREARSLLEIYRRWRAGPGTRPAAITEPNPDAGPPDPAR